MHRSRRRMLRASLRDTALLLGEFRTALIVFLVAILGSALLYFSIAQQVGEPLRNFTEAIYMVLSLAFFQPPGDFPESPFLEAFFFVMPLVGVGSLALGLADFGYLLFNRRARSKEWEMAVASTFDNHVILVGLGHLGFQVLKYLVDLDLEVVVIELDPDAGLVSEIHSFDIPVINDDANKQSALLHTYGIKSNIA